MKAFWDSFTSEFKRIVSDRGALLVILIAPILYAFFYPLPYLNQIPKRLPILVVDQDQSELSRLLIRKADENELLHVKGLALSLSEAEHAVRDGKAAGMIVISKDFERNVKRGQKGVIGAYIDAAYFLPYRQVLTGLVTTAGVMSAGVEIKRWESSGLPRLQAVRRQGPLRVELHNLFNPEGGYASYVVPAVLILIFQQTLLIGIGMLLGTAREGGKDATLLKHAPLKLAGRATLYVAIYLGHFLFYRLVVYPLFGFPFVGSLGAVMLFLTLYLYACVFLGFSLGRIWQQRESTMLFLVFTSLPALFLCGFAWPVQALPLPLRWASQLIPTTPAIQGYLKLAHMGAAAVDVWPEALTLVALAIFYGALATHNVKKTSRKRT